MSYSFHRRPSAASVLCAIAIALGPSCSSGTAALDIEGSGGDGQMHPPLDTGDGPIGLVVGVTSDLDSSDGLTGLLARITVDGVAQPTLQWSISEDETFPIEVQVPAAPNGASLEVELDAIGQSGVILTRKAATAARSERTLLLRTRLESECFPEPFLQPGTECDETSTCIAGKCRNYYRPPEELEDYAPDWSKPIKHACKTADGGAPLVVIGQGRQSYEPVTDVFLYEPGNQGGYHIWVSLELSNLVGDRPLTLFDAHINALDAELHSLASLQPYEVEGDTCRLVGFRFQLRPTGDQTDLDPAAFAGETVTVEVTVIDIEGQVAYATVDAELMLE